MNDLFVGFKINKPINRQKIIEKNVNKRFYLHFHRSIITLIKKRSIKMIFVVVQT